MDSNNKKVEKKQEAPKKGKAYVDTTNSKVVKGTGKAEVDNGKAVVENLNISEENVYKAQNREEFLDHLSKKRDELHDFAVDAGDRTISTKQFYEAITGKEIPPIFDEDGEEEELIMDWEQFNKYWDEIEEAAKNISEERMRQIIDENKYDLDPNYFGESFQQELMNALNEALSNKTMKASDVNAWLKENNLKDVISKLKAEDGKYNVEDIIKLISDKQRRELESDVVTTIDKLDEASSTDDDIDMDDDCRGEEKESSNTPEPKAISENREVYSINEEPKNETKSHTEMKRLIHLMSLRDNANELVNKFGLTDVQKIKESLVEELTDKEYEIVLEDVYKALNIEVKNNYEDNTEMLNESLRSDLHDKLI